MILPVLYLITVTIVREKRQIVGMFSVMVVSMFLIGMHFYRNFQHTGGQYREDRRWSGALSYLGPNEVGAFWAEYSFILLGVLLVCTLKFWRWPILATLGVSVYGLVYSFSRGAYAAFLVGFLFISLVSRNVKALAVLGGFLLFWTSLVPGSVVERVEMSRSEDGTLDSTLEGRLGRWQHGIDLFLRNPVGYGFETVRFLGFTGYLEVGSSGGDPHNRYIEFLVEMGVVGIVMFLYLFYLGFKSGWRLYTRGEDKFLKGLGLGFAATVVATMVANMFGDRWTYDILGAFYWVCWALVVRGNVIDQVGKAKAMAFPTSGEI
ncbi:MAG: O-antigen ligase family protein [Candidatus Methylomirabilales bacterium]